MKERYRFGLLGHNIGYSRSSRIFSIIGELRNVSIDFTNVDCPPESLSEAIDALAELNGFSVTIPHKVMILSYLEEISETARKTGAVNSVSVDGGRMRGYNTDVIGFAAPLRRMGFAGGRALVLGTGGAARAVIHALLLHFNTTSVTVCGRTTGKSGTTARNLAARFDRSDIIRAVSYEHVGHDTACDLIVNCTPIGGPSMPDQSPLPDTFEFADQPLCYDLVYDPERTVFLRRAREKGCRVIGGVSMLVRQAIESYTIWTGDEVDRDAIGAAVLAELRNKNKGL